MNLGEIKLKSQSSEHQEASAATDLLSEEHRKHQEKPVIGAAGGHCLPS